MAIYHFSAKVISRAAGSSALAAAAYRSASRLHDDRLDRHHDFSNKAGVVHSEVLLPEGAPEHLADREQLWNAVEAAEKRIDAQLAREIEFAIPREMTQEDGLALARDFVSREFVERGMIADLNLHWDIGADGLAKPHAHVMLTMREVNADGFGAKVRDWNSTQLLTHWREAWAEHVNERLAELDVDARVDHRSLEAQGVGLAPQNKIGPAASRMAEQGLSSERLAEHQAIAQANGDRILAHPEIALDAITHSQATFTGRDLAMFVHRHSDGKDQYDRVLSALRASPELVALGRDGRGDMRFTSRAMLATEQRLEQATDAMAERQNHKISGTGLERARAAAKARDLKLGWEQQLALQHITRSGDLKSLVGYAGTGKSTLLGLAREGWEGSGYRVQGLALSGIAAENLEQGSGIASRTIASMEHQWGQGRDLLTAKDVLVIDEAGMIGTRQMERVVAEANKRGAKIVLVGDPEQLQAIEAGAAFRSIAERHGAIEITEVRRQREDWQRDATRHLATGRTDEALAAYAGRGNVHASATRATAREALIDRWDAERVADPGGSRLILTHTRDEVRNLNELARERLREAGQLGENVTIRTERGSRDFACGDKIMFLRNERSMGVKNGTLGIVQSVSPARMAMMLDDGRQIAFDLKDYAHVDHGYAATIHKAQGVTVDRVHVLATPGLDRHSAYVALSRHREAVQLHYGEDDFADRGKLVRTLARERSKDMASDYARDFADRREIRVSPALVARSEAQPRSRAPIEQARPVSPDNAAAAKRQVRAREAIRRHARAITGISDQKRRGLLPTAGMNEELSQARRQLDSFGSTYSRDMESAFNREPALARGAVSGDLDPAIRAMKHEARVRADPTLRADRFVEQWRKLQRTRAVHEREFDYLGIEQTNEKLESLAKSLHRDPQLESILRNRVRQLGVSAVDGEALGNSLADWITRSRSRGLGI